MTSRPLFMSVDESIVIFGPIDQVGWARASSIVTSASSARVRPRNGPPLAVRTMRATRSESPPALAARHWCTAPCSESTGTMWPAPGRSSAARTTGPPAISDSLLASARRRPAAMAASVTRRPAKPTTPLTHTSATPPSSASASSPPRTSVPGGTRAATAAAWASSPITTSFGRRASAWPTRASTDDQAPSATTSKRSGSARTTSIVCVPIEPVEPAMATVVTATRSPYPPPPDAPGAGRRRSGQEEVAEAGQVPDGRQHKQDRIKPVEQAAMTRQDVAHVLDIEVALDERLGQVADGGGERRHQADGEAVGPPVERGRPEGPEHGAGHDGEEHAPGEALDRLVGAGRRQRPRAGTATDEQAPDVVGDGRHHGGEQERHAVGGHAEQQGGERAEHADPHDAEQRHADVGGGALSAGVDQVPQEADGGREHEAEGDGLLAVVVGGDDGAHAGHDPHRHEGLEAGPEGAVHELVGGVADDRHDDEHPAERAEDGEQHQRQRDQADAHHDGGAHVSPGRAGGARDAAAAA